MRWIACLMMLVPGCAIDGIHTAKPETEMRYGASGFSFSDTKDNDISAEEISVDGGKKSGTVKNLVIRNNASDVRRANVEQIDAMARQHIAIGQALSQYTDSLFNGLTGLATSLTPLQMAQVTKALPKAHSVDTPLGAFSSPGLSDTQINALMQIAARNGPAVNPETAALLARIAELEARLPADTAPAGPDPTEPEQ